MTMVGQCINSSFMNQRLAGAVLKDMFIGVSFARADLTAATLSGMFLNVDFTDATLVGANISGEFHGANFQGADLAFCNLRDSNICEHDLQAAHSLRGAVMPDGSPYGGHLCLPGD
jgi:uncharacterized protein YjbI with pentapeptide repeats